MQLQSQLMLIFLGKLGRVYNSFAHVLFLYKVLNLFLADFFGDGVLVALNHVGSRVLFDYIGFLGGWQMFF